MFFKKPGSDDYRYLKMNYICGAVDPWSYVTIYADRLLQIDSRCKKANEVLKMTFR